MPVNPEQKPELAIYHGPHHRRDIPRGHIAYLRSPDRTTHPVLYDGKNLPFRSNSVIFDAKTPRRDRALSDELNRVVGRPKDNPLPKESIPEIIPIIGRIIKTWNEWRKGEKGAENWRYKFAEELFYHDMLPTIDHLDAMLVKMEKDKVNGLLINKDYFLVALLRGGGARLLNAGVSAAAFLATGDVLDTGLTWLTREVILPAIVEGLYVAYRFDKTEHRALLDQLAKGDITREEYTRIRRMYWGLHFINCLPALPYTWSNFISAGSNSSVFNPLLRLNLIKSVQKFRLGKVADALRKSYREGFMPPSARAALEVLDHSPYPILTLSEAGMLGDENKLTASRAHISQPKPLEQALGLPVVDLGHILPKRDLRKFRILVERARNVARFPLLSMAREKTELISRRMVKVEPMLQRTVSFLMKELAKKSGRPIVTFHYSVGNSVIDYLQSYEKYDTPVIHYITDPHVHPNYLKYKELPFVYYFTFDEGTKKELMKKGVPQERIRVTGFPINRELKVDHTKDELENRYKPEYGKKLNVAVFTGGLGGNQTEIIEVARNLDYRTQKAVFYCGTNRDLADGLGEFFKNKALVVNGKSRDVMRNNQKLYDAVIVVDDNLQDLLPISYDILNWAHVVCTKPSGDISLEAMEAGKIVVPLRNLAEDHKKSRRTDGIG